MSVINWILENYQVLISTTVAVLSAIIAVSLLIPGPQPEKTLQKLVDWIDKLSLGKSGK